MAEQAAQVSRSGRSSVSSAPRRGPDSIETLALRIEALVERHRAAKSKINDLHELIDERDRRIRQLERGLDVSKKTRADVTRRIDGLIAQVEKLEGLGA